MKTLLHPICLLLVLGTAHMGHAQNTTEPPMLRPVPNTVGAWLSYPIFTVGETLDNGYQPVGITDGIGAVRRGNNVRFYVNHELVEEDGYVYSLQNGLELTGARISYFDIDRNTFQLHDGGLAYRGMVDRYGEVVTNADQINENGDPIMGLNRLCSSTLYKRGEYGLEDTIFFTGEETDDGQEFLLDVRHGRLYAAPMLGRAAFENVTMVDLLDPIGQANSSLDLVGAIIGDDREGAPLYLYIGVKDALQDGSFLDRNGFAYGFLYVWVADGGDLSPEDFNGTGGSRSGQFVQIPHYDPSKAGEAGYDEVGFADTATLDVLSSAAGAFQFSRPEDISPNPEDGTQVAFASTGRGSAYPSDNWGTTYLVDIEFLGGLTSANQLTRSIGIPAGITILYDGDDAGAGQFVNPDYGLRNPDNLDWANDGLIYIQEDRSTSPSELFGGVSGEEASLWALDPASGDLDRIAQIDRSAVPTGQMDTDPTDLGDWESSGVLDVTDLFGLPEGLTLLVADAQAHSVSGGPISDDNLVEGGQLLFLLGIRNPNGGLATKQALETMSLAEVRDLVASVGSDSLPEEPTDGTYALEAAYPNPFNPSTTLRFVAPTAGDVRVAVFDALGRQVAVLLDERVEAGHHDVRFDASDLPSGVYFARMSSAQGIQTQRLMLLK